MSVSVNPGSLGPLEALTEQLARRVDANKDGQISTTEFGAFLVNVLQGGLHPKSTTGTLSASLKSLGTTPAALDVSPVFLGFDMSRLESARGSLKYDAYHVLKTLDPRDPNAMRQAFTILDALHPGMYELDPQDNLMLTGTADGYIGARPINRDSDWHNRAQDWCWQWMGYNEAHPGPNGEIT